MSTRRVCSGWLAVLAVAPVMLAEATSTSTSTTSTTLLSKNDYVQRCEAALGVAVPAIDCWDAQATSEIVLRATEVDVTGKPKPGFPRIVRTPADLVTGPEGRVYCDNPFLIEFGANLAGGEETSCLPFSRIGAKRLVGQGAHAGETVDFAYICRTNFFRTPDRDGKVKFDDLGFIGHNHKTGATCFWSVPVNDRHPDFKGRCESGDAECTAAKKGEDCFCNGAADCENADCAEDEDKSFDGSNIPKPGNGETFWNPVAKVASGGCMTCHDSDAFVRTPAVAATNKVPANALGPYFAVAGDVMAAHPNIEELRDSLSWALPLHIESAATQPCTKHHRIGAYETCKTFVDDAGGFVKRTTTAEFFYPRDTWMPHFDHTRLQPRFPTEGKWMGAHEQAVYAIWRCCPGLIDGPLGWLGLIGCLKAVPPGRANKGCCERTTGQTSTSRSYEDVSVCLSHPGATLVTDDLCDNAPEAICCAVPGQGFHHRVTAEHCADLGGTQAADDTPCADGLSPVCCELPPAGSGPTEWTLRQDCAGTVGGVEVDQSECPVAVCCAWTDTQGVPRVERRRPGECTTELDGMLVGDDAPCEVADAEVCCELESGERVLATGRSCAGREGSVVVDSLCTCGALGGTTCESGDNDACHGEGPPSTDCDHCCGEALTPSCDGLGGTTCEVAGNGACGGAGPSTFDCDHCCGGVAHLAPCPPFGGPGEPLGPGELGCVPSSGDARRCEDRAAKGFRRAAECVLKCRRLRARGSLASPAKELTCEEGSSSGSCRRRLETFLGSASLDVSCPSCLDAPARAALFEPARAVVDLLNPALYCGAGAPWGNGHAGFVPSLEATVRCENTVAKALGAAMRCLTRCHRARARGFLTPTEQAACDGDAGVPTSCLAKYLAATSARHGAFDGCSACLDVDGRAALFARLESALDASTALTFCAP